MAKPYRPNFSFHKTKYGFHAYNVNWCFGPFPSQEALKQHIEEYFTKLDAEEAKQNLGPALESYRTGCCFFCRQPLPAAQQGEQG